MKTNLKTKSINSKLLGLTFISFALTACTTQSVENTQNEELTSKLQKGLVIRGGSCSRQAFIDGAEHVSPDGSYITNLSVNCTNATSDKANFVNYLTPPPYGQYCVAKWSALEKLNVKIKKDPITGNDLHCLVSGKTKDIVAKLTRY